MSDDAAAAKRCDHYWAWVSPAGTSHWARLCMTCHQPDPEWLDEITGPSVPRVAHSLDDLRVGQVVATRDKTDVWVTWPIRDGDLVTTGWVFDGGRVVILSDPPPDPVDEAYRKGWHDGWAALASEHMKQRRDPSYPIGQDVVKP